MSSLGLPENVWVVVCDGHKALFLQNAGDHVYPKLELRDTIEHPNRPTHELGTDGPGRIVSAGTGRQSAMEPPDLHDIAATKFLKKLVSQIDDKVLVGEINKLVIVAPSHALGVMRHEYSPHLKAHLLREIHKDLLHLPIYEIERHLA